MSQSNWVGQTSDTGNTGTEGVTLETHSTLSKRQRESNGSAYGVQAGSSDLIFFEGILPEESGVVMNEPSTEDQTDLCLDRLQSVLAASNLTLEDVMKIEVQLTDIGTRDVVDDVYKRRFDGSYPPRTTTGVYALPGNAGIQLDVVAAIEQLIE
ncbi:RidA family protein [Natronosalvus amylolyticus]|uniref:RidA family protein n=1 Tax=Natronosalvus amylolyticus TaxID=2961994 RepID=UPI0020C9B13C|nr:RidA family protein [Natronosalvus amylolyticus]